ncbi:GlxA family transcriptional regulator [Serratia marcescens]|uniref:GlxA family transcriptional regulator n=1 Tax=Serratia marcescens TaxID=615 RepID=UPI0007451CF9|nr:helix-turn-helix domain-containing protein [Serratia marcescens]MBH3209534.1 helix-turn-helix domain-containing protein [Serratia marcescens]NCI54102.1 helix-turn-helix domain-containing protein [Serratia marcescens]NDJ06086.1 helix-turn-helix domain-containing protein [Serratia marcescens]NDJ29291.1 helix-turn-helix domain-containing protein [Serratia marcescens]NDJ43375.1 helix-turn-helix domain-containing protein [Serratia marcescens]
MSLTKIGIVVFDGIIPFHLSVPCAVFEKALNPQGMPYYQMAVCAAQPGPLRTNAGFSIIAEHDLSVLDDADIVIIPSWVDPTVMPPAELISALQRAHSRGAKVVGLCMGAFVLAESGMLHGRPATTHWNWMPHFMRRYPSVSIDRDVLYVDDGDVITSAGTAASIDCCLHLVRQQCGAEVANRVARQLVVPPHRQGGQAQFIEHAVCNTQGGDRFMKALDWAVSNLQLPHTVEALADKAYMSRRTFTRRFQQSTGTTLTQWLLSQRLALAQRFLEKTDQSIEQIALVAGFSSTLSMRRHFQQQFKTSPSRYRKEFHLKVK